MNRNIISALVLLFLFSCHTAPDKPKALPPSLWLENADSILFYTDRAELEWTQFYPAKGFELQAVTPMGTESFYFDSRKRLFSFKFSLSGPYHFKIRALTGDGGVSQWSKEVFLDVKPVLTAVTAENRIKTYVLELHPAKRDNIIISVPGVHLADIRDGDGTLYLLSSPVHKNSFGNQLLFSVIDPDSGIIRQNLLSWPFGKSEQPPKSAGICRINQETIAFTAWTEHATGLFIIDTEGNLLARELLPDFLLGPETNYREGKTDLARTQAFTTEYYPVDKLLIIRGKANRENEKEKHWRVGFDPAGMTFTESTLTEEFPSEQPLFSAEYGINTVELKQNSSRNLTIKPDSRNEGAELYTIFRDSEGFLSPISLWTKKILKSDYKTLYLSAEFTENGRTLPICIYIRLNGDSAPSFTKVSVPNTNSGAGNLDLRFLESSPIPDEQTLLKNLRAVWKGLDSDGNPVYFQPAKADIARIDYQTAGIGNGGFVRWDTLWKREGFSQIVLHGDGGTKRKVIWEIIGWSEDEMMIYDLMNAIYVYLWRDE